MLQLFRFQAGDRVLLISAVSEDGARELLRRYLKACPLVARYEDCRLKEVCGHVYHGIYTLSGV